MSIVKAKTPDVETTPQLVEDESKSTALHEVPTESLQNASLQEPPAGSGTLHLNLHGVYSAKQLASGVTWSVKDFDVCALPKGRVLVDRVATEAIGSNVASNLMVSANIFNGSGTKTNYMQSGVTNAKGWVTSERQSELVPLGFVPIVSLMPNEYNRKSIVHYQPTSGVDDSLVERYGHLSTGEGLRNNIVSFPNEDYCYVAKDHVVLDIIERNWDQLGSDVPSERVREGNWLKVSKGLVENVLDQLDSKVLKHMPLTDLNKLKFKMRADKSLVSYLDPDSDYPVSLTMTVSYRSLDSEPASA